MTKSQKLANLLIKAAQLHGEDDEPDHEVGDLQTFLREALALMEPYQIERFLKNEEVRETYAVGAGKKLKLTTEKKPGKTNVVFFDRNKTRIEDRTMIQINAPAVFNDPAFIDFLNSGCATTWHKGSKPNEYSDVFFTWNDAGEGNHSPEGPEPGIPEHIWNQLTEFLRQKGYTEVFVWLTNLQD